MRGRRKAARSRRCWPMFSWTRWTRNLNDADTRSCATPTTSTSMCGRSERVMASLRKLFGKLKLRINENKSKVTRATKAKFLGFSFWLAKGRVVRRRVAPEAIERLKERVRELTRRSAGRSLAQMCKPLGTYLSGWKAYFRLTEAPGTLA